MYYAIKRAWVRVSVEVRVWGSVCGSVCEKEVAVSEHESSTEREREWVGVWERISFAQRILE